MKLLCSVLLSTLASVGVLGGIVADFRLERTAQPSKYELELSYGGSCDYCRSQDFCKNSVPCTPLDGHPGYYYKWVATGITQKFCSSFVKNKPGKTFCESVDPKDCVIVYTCTDSKCDETVAGNCGPASQEVKTTDCDFKNSKDCTT